MPTAEPEALRWNLADLYASPQDPALESDLTQAASKAAALATRYRGKLEQLSPAQVLEALRSFERLMELAYKPQLYAQLLFSGQTDSEPAQALLARTRQAGTEVFNEVKFFDVELRRMSAPRFEALLHARELEPFRHYLEAQRRFAPHTLSESEEQVYSLLSLTGRVAFSQLYTEVSARILIPLEVEGQTKELNVSEVRALRSSPDRALRRRAVDGLMHAFEQHSHVINFCFNTLLQDHALEIKKRGFSRAEAPTFLEDELAPEVVEGLLATTERHYPLAQRYMRLKARALGLADFSSHDLLAPLTAVERKVPYDEARGWVLEAFKAFEPSFADVARRFFDERWIDALPRAGKRDGAFCSGMLPSLHPYVLLNYAERVEDASTLAHELGHGIHFYLSRRNSPLNFWATTPMAETASVFAELLLMRRLLEKEKDPSVRRHLLALRIEDILATVFNQVSYTRWEQRAHARREKGVVPAEEFAQLWLDERARLYGDAVRFLPQDRWGWASIGHFVHYRFYCYSYAFGQLLVLALFGRYEEEGKAFIPRYVELLSSGSSDTPQKMLARVGLDVTEPRFWDQGFATLGALLDEFEALLPKP